MPSLHGFSAWITVSKNRLEEFQPESEDNGKKVTCWIPSEEGKEFVVEFKDHQGLTASTWDVVVDGLYVGTRVLATPQTSARLEGVPSPNSTITALMFSRVNLTDNETLADPHDASNAHVGTIQVKVSRVVVSSFIGEQNFKGGTLEALKTGRTLHERSKKAGSHCVALGAMRPSQARRYVKCAPYDPSNPGPVVTFVFRYRSADILRAQDIIPRLYTLSETGGKRRASTEGGRSSSPEAIHSTKRFKTEHKEISAREKSLNDLKKSGDPSSHSASITVTPRKKEKKPSQRAPPEVIDLCSD